MSYQQNEFFVLVINQSLNEDTQFIEFKISIVFGLMNHCE